LPRDQKYKGEKCITRAKGMFTKHVLKDKKWFYSLAKLGWDK
jgi:hypothetical protein